MDLQGQGRRRYKTYIVAQGWGRVHGIDCGATYAPVCRLLSIRMMLAIATEYNLEVVILDVQAAFFNADIEEEVYYECL